jgi:hypothetical protein
MSAACTLPRLRIRRADLAELPSIVFVPSEVSIEWFRALFQEARDRVPRECRLKFEVYWRGRVAPPGCPLFKDCYDPHIVLARDDGLPAVNHGSSWVTDVASKALVKSRLSNLGQPPIAKKPALFGP